MEKWWNEICGRGKEEKPRKQPTRLLYVHHKTNKEGTRRELCTPAMRVASNRLRHGTAVVDSIFIYSILYIHKESIKIKRIHINEIN